MEQDVQRRDEQEVGDEKQDAVHRVSRCHDQHGETQDECRDRVERDGFAHYDNATLMIAVTTRLTIASGISTFHPRRINWS